ncbi:hypothetical protein N7G274_008741 [Stereocaulon virgatum]|uniref:non-specific serine/threonine protein kinase n=1 Tax=Stereocaulon virgatum TaxID=373712 RepID=A0ABR4A213_9LECA
MSPSSDTSTNPVSLFTPKLTLITKMLGLSTSDDKPARQQEETNSITPDEMKFAYLVSSEGIEIRQPQIDNYCPGVDQTSSKRGSPSSIISSKTDGSDIEVSTILTWPDPIVEGEADDDEVVPSSFERRMRSLPELASELNIDLCSLVGTPISQSEGEYIENWTLADEGMISQALGVWAKHDYPPIDPKYDLVKELGFGGEGHCSLVSRRSDKHLFALKQVKGPQLVHTKPIEVVVQALFEDRHENIIRLHYFESFTESPLVRFYFEYCNGGDLCSLINDYREINSYIPELFIWRSFVQLASALEFLHRGFDRRVKNRVGVVHRDVKPENIFVRRPANENAHPTVVLGDFGLATFQFATYEHVGTDLWQGPETPRKTPRGDVWALGAVIHTMLHLRGPTVEFFEDDKKTGIKKRTLIKRVIEDVPEYYSSEVIDMMLMACEPEQSRRVNSSRLLNVLTDFVNEYVPQFHAPYVNAELWPLENPALKGSPESQHLDNGAKEGIILARGVGDMVSNSPIYDQMYFIERLEFELEKLKEGAPPAPFQISSVL